MSEADLNLPKIVPLLQLKSGNGQKPNANSRQQPSTPTNQSDAYLAQHPDLVPSSLKIETATLTKELSKFRACDQNTCFYCREWAQWIFKKSFGKDKGVPGIEKKGRSSGNAQTGSEPKKKHKEYAMVVCERFYQRSTADGTTNNSNGRSTASTGAGSVAAAAIAASKTGTGTNPTSQFPGTGHEGFVSEIIETVREWMSQPSALYTSPEVFSLIDFESLYAQYSHQNQENNTQQDDITPILATVTQEKAHMVLSHQGYPLLKRVTKAQLQNQIMNPTCQHTKVNSKTPVDLESEREHFNEDLTKMRTRDQEGLRKQIGPVWRHVEEALDRMEGAEKVRSGILASTRSKEFAQTYKDQLLSFQEIWGNVENSVKKPPSKKKGLSSESSQADPVEDVDRGFQLFIDNMQHVHKQLTSDVLESSERSLREFIKELAAAQTKILKLALVRIQDGKVGAARIDKILEESPEKCRNALKMVEQLNPIFDTKMAQFRVLVLNKLKEVDEEVEAVAAAYLNDSQKTVQGRLEKAANKDFRRRIKKLEFLSLETRKWFFQSRLTLFSSLDFATVCLNTLGILMEEAEVLEAVQLGLHDDQFRSRVVKSQEGRMRVTLQFREGIKTGRRVLAVMISRLMMREGARAMGEVAAIQKEIKFLKSIGQDVSDNKLNAKGYLVPSRDATPTASAQVSDDEDIESHSGTPTVSKNKKKKDKKKKKAAEAAAAVVAVPVSTSAEEMTESIPEATPPTTNRTTPSMIGEHTPVVSGKEARELKKQAKKDAKRQAKDTAGAEEEAAAQVAAKKAEEDRRIQELEELKKSLQQQEAKELKEKKEAELARKKKIAEDAEMAAKAKAQKEAEDAAKAKKEAEAAARAKKEAEATAKAKKEAAAAAAKVKKEAEEAAAKAKKETEEAAKVKKEAEKVAKAMKEAERAKAEKEELAAAQLKKEAKVIAKAKKAQEKSESQKVVSKDEDSRPSVDQNVKSFAQVTKEPVAATSSKGHNSASAESKVPAWGPSATTLANRAAHAVKDNEHSQQSSKKRVSDGWGEKPSTDNTNGSSNWEHSEWDQDSKNETASSGWGQQDSKSVNASSGWESKDDNAASGWGSKDDNATSGWGSKDDNATSGWDSKNDNTSSGWDSKIDNTSSGWESKNDNASSGWDSKNDNASSGWDSKNDNTSSGWDSKNDNASGGWGSKNDNASGGWGTKNDNSSSGWGSKNDNASGGWGSKKDNASGGWGRSDNRSDTTSGWGRREKKSDTSSGSWGREPEHSKARPRPSIAESDREDDGKGGSEDLSGLPTKTLVTLVQTLQAENKSLLTTLVSMQHQVSSLTERYSTLATLAREHEQQAIQAMESQKQREIEEYQRYTWKVEDRCRQLEHLLTRVQMQQMQQSQQFQHQQHQTLTSGPPGIPLANNMTIPPPGFSNLQGLGRSGSAPPSPPSVQRALSGMDSPSSNSPVPIPSNITTSATFSSAAPFTNGSIDSPQIGFLNSSLLSSVPSSTGASSPSGFESGPKKTHWRQRGEVRCGNCAYLGHSSADCQAGCRYCDQDDHLSQDCPRMSIPLHENM
ncbi:hypothetical protein BGZ76_004605 [Entomortierella beljakovae]|nr:hypothetical protein BGZ76_004605 [Entomortierella beljakovae]